MELEMWRFLLHISSCADSAAAYVYFYIGPAGASLVISGAGTGDPRLRHVEIRSSHLKHFVLSRTQMRPFSLIISS